MAYWHVLIIFVYVDNLAANPVVIDRIIFAGIEYTFDNDAKHVVVAKKDGELSWGQFAITDGLSIDTTKTNVIPSGKEVTIAIRYSGSSGDIAIGKPISVNIVTDNGWTFPVSIRNGMQSL